MRGKTREAREVGRGESEHGAAPLRVLPAETWLAVYRQCEVTRRAEFGSCSCELEE